MAKLTHCPYVPNSRLQFWSYSLKSVGKDWIYAHKPERFRMFWERFPKFTTISTSITICKYVYTHDLLLVFMRVLSIISGNNVSSKSGWYGSLNSSSEFMVKLKREACSRRFLAIACQAWVLPYTMENFFQPKCFKSAIIDLVTWKSGGCSLTKVG